ncbi:MAG: hypothetical protein AAFS10_04070 [Myxococcota bacterium]
MLWAMLIVLTLVVCALLAVALLVQHQRYHDQVVVQRLLEAWQWAGHQYGLTFFQRRSDRPVHPTEGDLRLRGELAGTTIDLRARLASPTWTRAELQLHPPLPIALEVVCEGQLELLVEAHHRFEGVGDEGFDPYFLMASDDITRAYTLLTPETRAGLGELHQLARCVRLTHERLVVESPHVLEEGRQLERWIDALLDVAQALSQARHREAAQFVAAPAVVVTEQV